MKRSSRVARGERENGVVSLRSAVRQDLQAITEIYNEAILTTTATFDTKPQTVAQRLKWFRKHNKRHPIVVAEVHSKVVGWASLSPWSDRAAYADTAETSFYVKSEYRGRGIGGKLKAGILEEARRSGFHSLVAQIADGSGASLHLNKAAGYRHVGTLKEVGRKFGRLIDVHVMQKML